MILKWDYYDDEELKKRGYGFFFTLYPDSNTYDTQKILEWIKRDGECGKIYKYAYILHDKDEDDKPHYHVAIKYKERKVLRAVLLEFMLWNYNPNNYETIIRKWKSVLNYLIHNTKESRNKYQYAEDSVISNIPNTIYSLRSNKDDEDIFSDIVDYIYDRGKDMIRIKDVIDYCNENEDRYLTVFLKKEYLFTTIIKERNNGYLT